MRWLEQLSYLEIAMNIDDLLQHRWIAVVFLWRHIYAHSVVYLIQFEITRNLPFEGQIPTFASQHHNVASLAITNMWEGNSAGFSCIPVDTLFRGVSSVARSSVFLLISSFIFLHSCLLNMTWFDQAGIWVPDTTLEEVWIEPVIVSSSRSWFFSTPVSPIFPLYIMSNLTLQSL